MISQDNTSTDCITYTWIHKNGLLCGHFKFVLNSAAATVFFIYIYLFNTNIQSARIYLTVRTKVWMCLQKYINSSFFLNAIYEQNRLFLNIWTYTSNHYKSPQMKLLKILFYDIVMWRKIDSRTSTVLHALQLPLIQRYVPWFLQKDSEPSRLILFEDHEVEILCLPLDFFQVPMILSKEGMPHPTWIDLVIWHIRLG